MINFGTKKQQRQQIIRNIAYFIITYLVRCQRGKELSIEGSICNLLSPLSNRHTNFFPHIDSSHGSCKQIVGFPIEYIYNEPGNVLVSSYSNVSEGKQSIRLVCGLHDRYTRHFLTKKLIRDPKKVAALQKLFRMLRRSKFGEKAASVKSTRVAVKAVVDLRKLSHVSNSLQVTLIKDSSGNVGESSMSLCGRWFFPQRFIYRYRDCWDGSFFIMPLRQLKFYLTQKNKEIINFYVIMNYFYVFFLNLRHS